MPSVAQVGAQALFLAYFSVDSACAPSPQAHQSSFYLQNPTSILLLCFSFKLDVQTQAWRGSKFDPFWHPFAGFSREMPQNAHLTNC